jgi:hypothetical protein
MKSQLWECPQIKYKYINVITGPADGMSVVFIFVTMLFTLF